MCEQLFVVAKAGSTAREVRYEPPPLQAQSLPPKLAHSVSSSTPVWSQHWLSHIGLHRPSSPALHIEEPTYKSMDTDTHRICNAAESKALTRPTILRRGIRGILPHKTEAISWDPGTEVRYLDLKRDLSPVCMSEHCIWPPECARDIRLRWCQLGQITS